MAPAALTGLRNLPERLGPMAADYGAYWLSLPKIDGVPMKSALELGAMRNFAASFVMVERHDPRKFTWRLAGSAIREISGIELTGTDALAVRDAEQIEKGVVAYNAQLDTPCGAWGIVILRSAAGNQMPTEVLTFPLRADDGSLRFLANTVEPRSPRLEAVKFALVEMKLLSWAEHRFIDIGFGLPKLPRRRS
jgi:hypothetical protein